MRINQIQNLCWAANVIVFAGMAFVGYQFAEAAKTRKDVPEYEWPKRKAVTLDTHRWPGDAKKFEHIWKTYVHGVVPKVVVKDDTPVVKKDPKEVFKKACKYQSGWHWLATPTMTTISVEYNGKEQTVQMGATLDGWQLVGYRFEQKPAEDGKVSRTDVTYWKHARHGSVVIEQPIAPERIFEGGEGKTFKPEFDPKRISRQPVPKGQIARKAYQDALDSQTWHVPQSEVDWWEDWGESEVWEKLAVRPHKDAEGISHGIKLMSTPGPGTALEGDRGLKKDDIIKSINGVPVNSKEDALGYVRGEGKGLKKYVVVYETAGRERTVTYRLSDRRKRRGSKP